MKKSIVLSFAVLSVFISNAHSAVVAQWIAGNVGLTEVEPEPWNYADNVAVSKLTVHGSIEKAAGTSRALWQGWTTTVHDTMNYLGFTITPEPGFQLSLTDLDSVPANPRARGLGHSWGVRVNNGSGFGAWTFQATQTENGYLNEFLVPITTTGTVELGFFAWALTPEENYTPFLDTGGNYNLELNGTVSAVPEPSAALLAGLGALALLRRRR